eukprot:7888842-Lingulodinium_polyedra.AAC.1
MSEGGLRVLGSTDATRKAYIRDPMALQGVLKVRAYAHEIVEACSYKASVDLADAFLRWLKRRIPKEM